MDETKQTEGLPSVKAEKAPEGSEGTTPKESTKTYTEDDVQKAVQNALIKAGRTAKDFENREASLKTQQQEIDETKAEISKIQERIDEAELEAAEGDPAKLRELQAKKSYKTLVANLDAEKKKLLKEREELDRDKAEHASAIEAAQQATLEMKIFELAVEYDLNPQDIKDAMTELKLTTPDQAVAIAKRLSGKPKEPTKGPGKTDSLLTSGNKESSEGKTARQIYADNFRSLHKK